ncbi:uncharacterized protein LOC122048389 [Zingiber officinale]|uniref:Uncharacterized protein n=1 Tax=Zingiber officinale TaxID=94328 RepID=A0A8J5M412_ZINOF|nr:uncharacterized protein LOC122048389 [Zingiber officinale]KAG6531148.1 hypothetical protein ZIOFF_004922 [Zingiber officinale]
MDLFFRTKPVLWYSISEKKPLSVQAKGKPRSAVARGGSEKGTARGKSEEGEMDPKASAKSKRSHTQHGRASHPSPSAIAQRKKQSKEKKLEQSAGGGDGELKRTRRPSLPSNWDRYDDEDEVVESVGNPSATEVAPKSKGADFGYLLEQARSQQQERDKLAGLGLPLPSSSEEFPLGLWQGLSSILSVRGEGRLSLYNDDNFIIDDSEDSSISSEVPFLSIDLHAIDAQLSKLKLSDRLFLEADLFPEEQCVGELIEKKMSEQLENLVAREFKKDFAQSASADVDKTALFDNYQPQISAGNATELHSSKGWTSKETQTHNSDSSMFAASNPAEITTSKFEVAAAEADLDMLLDSLSKTKLSNASVDEPGSSRNATTSPIDDTMDSLLATTSSFVQEQKTQASTTKQGSVLISNRPSHVLGATLDGGANSLRTGAKLTLDDNIDDLLGETSIFVKNQKPRLPHGPSSGSKPLDDFDSWIDTL